MTDTIEQKALALAIETRVDDRYRLCPDPTLTFGLWEALCRAIEQHEAFRQEVSDKVAIVEKLHPTAGCYISDLIIPKPVDPLVEVFYDVDTGPGWDSHEDYIRQIRAAIEKRGGKIIFNEE